MKKTGPTQGTVDIVHARALYACERCGRAVSAGACEVHHRKPRGLGGSSDPLINSPSNLLLLCTECHLWVERYRNIAYEQGWLVRYRHNPAERPAFLAGRGYCFLTPHGDVEEIDDDD